MNDNNDYIEGDGDMKDIMKCPKCGNKFNEVNGLYVSCKCGYIEDSTFEQITKSEDFVKKS